MADIELERHVLWRSRRRRVPSPLGEELSLESAADVGVADASSASGDVEGILVVVGRKRMQGVSRTAKQVVTLRRGDDENVQALLREQRAHRMHSRPARSTDGPEEPEADAAVLVEQPTAVLGKLRFERSELAPRHHRGSFTRAGPLHKGNR